MTESSACRVCGFDSEMFHYVHEIGKGFSVPDAQHAETILIRARSQQDNLRGALQDAGHLGLFFPGSPLWEASRVLRAHGQVGRTNAFFRSVRNGHHGANVVDNSSVATYFKCSASYLHAGEDAFKDFSNPSFDGAQNDSSGGGAETFEMDGSPSSPRLESAATSTAWGYDDATADNPMAWRDWVPRSYERLVNYDGQFITEIPVEEGFPDLFPFGWFTIPVNATVAASQELLTHGMFTSRLYKLSIWIRRGIRTYMSDVWNTAEFISYSIFLVQFYIRAKMYTVRELSSYCSTKHHKQPLFPIAPVPTPLPPSLFCLPRLRPQAFALDNAVTSVFAGLQLADKIDLELEEVQSPAQPDRTEMLLLSKFSAFNDVYVFSLTINAVFMWLKLFKYYLLWLISALDRT